MTGFITDNFKKIGTECDHCGEVLHKMKYNGHRIAWSHTRFRSTGYFCIRCALLTKKITEEHLKAYV